MRAVIQRVSRGKVSVEGNAVAEIGAGYVILLGVGPNDTEANARALARKIAMLRVIEDEQGKMNLSLLDTGGQAIVVSQFTLYADTRKGHRPSFVNAAPPEKASPLVDRFVELLREQGVPTGQGIFGAHMVVEIINNGPVTILLEDETPRDTA
jgi:D-tyrosyl-tRNA(Tyr) deacylase